MSILTLLRDLLPTVSWSGAAKRGTEIGLRPNEDNRLRHLYNQMLPDMELRSTILEIRRMDRLDPRVKKIHGRTPPQSDGRPMQDYTGRSRAGGAFN